MNKAILALTLTLGSASTAWANDTQPDPSDLTAVNSFAYGTVNSAGKLNGMLGLAGNYSEGNNFIGLVEHGVATKNNQLGNKDQNSRLRYFQVLDTGSNILPQAGFSVDYMKDWKGANTDTSSNIVALGAIAKMPTPWQALSLYPNVAYVKGKAEQGTSNRINLSGYQLNLFGSIALDNLGKYLVIQPQFMHLDGKPSQSGSRAKLSANIFKVKTGFGMPISTNGKWWTELSHTYTRSDAKANQIGKFADGALSEIDNDHKVELGVSYYF